MITDNRPQIEEIKAKLDLKSLVERKAHVTLTKSGRMYKGNCPLHDDKTASFFVYPDTNSFNCYGCNKSGDAFHFVQELEGVNFGAALQTLAGEAGVVIYQDPKDLARRARIARLLNVMSIAATYYQSLLSTTSLGATATTYIKVERDLTKKSLQDWGLGVAAAPKDFKEYMLGQGVTEQELVDTGLVVVLEDSTKRPVFYNQIMYPIRDTHGQIIAFGARVIPGVEPESSKRPKYKNSPNTELFNKSNTLYGFDRAIVSIKKSKTVVIVEGYNDVIAAHQAGFTNVVAPMGTSLGKGHLDLIRGIADKVVLALDPDKAGFRATERVVSELDLGDLTVCIATLPDGLDPDEVVSKDPNSWQQLITDAKPVDEYYINLAIASCDMTSSTSKQDLVKRIKVLFSFIQISPVKRAHYITYTARLLKITEGQMSDMLLGKAKAKPKVAASSISSNSDNTSSAQALSPLLKVMSTEDKLMAYLITFASPIFFGQMIDRLGGSMIEPRHFNQTVNQALMAAIIDSTINPDDSVSYGFNYFETKYPEMSTHIALLKEFISSQVEIDTPKQKLDTVLNLFSRLKKLHMAKCFEIAGDEDDDAAWVLVSNYRELIEGKR